MPYVDIDILEESPSEFRQAIEDNLSMKIYQRIQERNFPDSYSADNNGEDDET